MRLEDWQKWLDSQFVEAPAASEAASESQGGEEFSATVELVQPSAYVPPAAVSAPTMPVVEPPTLYRSAESVAPPSLPSQEPEEEQQALQPPSQPASPAPLAQRPAVVALSAEDEDITVPAIENYLPFLRSKRDDAREKEVPESRQEAFTERRQEPHVSQSAGAATLEAPSASDGPEPPPPARRFGPSSRTSRSGTRHKSEKVAAPITAEEVWSLVPRHLRTLISMGRRRGDAELL
jgi:hypothetical protein